MQTYESMRSLQSSSVTPIWIPPIFTRCVKSSREKPRRVIPVVEQEMPKPRTSTTQNKCVFGCTTHINQFQGLRINDEAIFIVDIWV
mmetsp:Transcript_5423/g.15340  ORF Transcript_5423/g.15340 Transcript_5423/m.15340 type:complete len:87 (+) Transcript_5423:176-436(+)